MTPDIIYVGVNLVDFLQSLPADFVLGLLQTPNEFQTIVDVLQKLFTIAAIVVGGIWAYFNFFKGRTYRMRLEPETYT
jgi:hypothetical protein